MKAILRLAVLVVAVVAAPLALAATAMFTGKQEMVQTVTYQMAWKCEYQYGGQYFYFIFKNSCPSSVEVE